MDEKLTQNLPLNEAILVKSSEILKRAPIVESGEENFNLFFAKFLESIVNSGEHIAHFAFVGGPVPAGKTTITYEILYPRLITSMRKAGLEIDNVEILSRDEYENIVGYILKFQLQSLLGEDVLDKIKTREKLTSEISSITSIDSKNIINEFLTLVYAHHKLISPENNINENLGADMDMDIDLIKNLLSIIPGRFLDLNDKKKIDDELFLQLVGAAVTRKIEKILEQDRPFSTCIIDGPIGEEYNRFKNSRFYLTRIFKLMAQSQGLFEKYKGKYLTGLAGITAGPKINIGAVGRSAIKKAITLEEAQIIAQKCDLNIPMNKTEWLLAGSGAEYQIMQEVFELQVDILRKAGLEKKIPALRIITTWNKMDEQNKNHIEEFLLTAQNEELRKILEHVISDEIINILLEARDVALLIDENDPPQTIPYITKAAWRILVGKLLENIALDCKKQDNNLLAYIVAYNNPHIDINKISRGDIQEIRKKYGV